MDLEVAGDEEQLLLAPGPQQSLQTEGSSAAAGTPPPAAAARALQASHFLSTWGQRGWEFTVGLAMLELWPSSLLLVGVWGLLDATVSVLFGAAVGRFVDSHPRLQAASSMYLLQNTTLAASAAGALALLWSGAREGPLFWGGLAATMVSGAVSTLGALGSSLSVEREWTKTLCGDSGSALAALNAAMKRIDLTCLIASPIAAGLAMQLGGKQPSAAAALLSLIWNLLCWAPEVLLLRYAQRCSPALAADRSAATAGQKPEGDAAGPVSSSKQLDDTVEEPAGLAANSGHSNGSLQRVVLSLRQQLQAWALYAQQPAAPSALALALLYLTVMSWGTLMTAYIKALGMQEAQLAVYRGLGALSGITATLAFPPLHRALGLVATGVVAIWLQLACLLAAVLPAALAAAGVAVGASVQLHALVWGLVLSRLGLWGFDLAANQLLQETAGASDLGVVSGVQGSLQSLCQLLAYLAGVLVPAPSSFVYLMAGSCGVVALAAAIHTAFALRTSCGRTVCN